MIGTPIRSSPTGRVQRASSDRLISSPIPLCNKSFLDDDWLKERVKHDSKMAQVAGGLVRSETTTPPHLLDFPGGFASLIPNFGHVVPPVDYVCKLCAVPGHWMKDCHQYEHRPSITRISCTNSVVPTHNLSVHSSSNSLQKMHPPGNYVCRLCGVPGHWIEQCSKFQPRKEMFKIIGHSVPPKNYVCNLCHQPGHWIQHCSEFTPMHHHHHHQSSNASQHRRSTSATDRPGSRYNF